MSNARPIDQLRQRLTLAVVEAGWPSMLAALLVVIGALLWAAASWFDTQSLLLRRGALDMNSVHPTRQFAPQSIPSDGSPLSSLVASREWYLDDVEKVFGLANQHGVQVFGFTYDRESRKVASFEVQGLSLRLKGEYPKLKAFLAGLMAALPHCYVADLRLERASPSAPSLDGTLKISFIYRGTDAFANSTNAGASGPQNETRHQ